MDLHKIIHSALHEFIQTYIPDVDLRYTVPGIFICIFQKKSFGLSVFH